MKRDMKRNLLFIIITFVSVLLGVLAVLTAVKLRQEQPIAPTAPESKPQALEGIPVPACQLSFTISLASPGTSPSPSPSPSQTPSPSPSPSVSPSPSPSPSVSPSPSPSPSVSPSPIVGCGYSCTSTTQCSNGLVCYITAGQTTGVCRTGTCQEDTDCICDITQNPSPTPTPSVIPTVPVAGNMWPTTFLIIGGVALLILGFAL